MRKNNNILTVFICASLIVASSFTSLLAKSEIGVCNEPNITIHNFVTKEPTLPRVGCADYDKKIAVWESDVKEYLESFYNQRVIQIDETVEAISFTFETKYMSREEQVKNVTYYRQIESTSSVGDTKITTYEQWSNGAVPVDVDCKTASNYAAAGSILISLCVQETKYMSAIISAVAAYLGWNIDITMPIKVETRAAAKYTRRIGSYYLQTGVWYPNVQIGKVEYWYYHTVYQPTYTNGPWIPHHKDNIPNADETNYSRAYYKNHYSDATWIRNKSSQLANSGEVYVDIFG